MSEFREQDLAGAVLIYKILLPAEWDAFQSEGRFDGSPFDRSSGFIHFSSRDQVGATAQRVFSAEPVLVVVAVDAELLGESLRWEPARNGEPFPHVYGTVPLTAVVAVHRVSGASSVAEAVAEAVDGVVDGAVPPRASEG